ncbi:hypothetical protein GCM10009740_05790 [Terrabacter terrae]|uniref:J domain-containing protein n=1 Tax=Terrabacter terrae TaxID=318434 RepID=A0ABP5FAJ5_9MICO
MVRSSDLYAVLGVPPSATQEQVRRAYRVLVRRHHPDTRDAAESAASDARDEGPGTADGIQRAMAAYAVLGDPRLRADYDRSREGPARESRQGRPVVVRRRGPRAPVEEAVQPPIRVGPVRWHRSS